MCPSGGSQWSWRKFAAQHKRAREAVSLSVASGTGTWRLYHQESPLKHTQLPTCDKLLLPSPFPLLTVSAFSSHSGLSGVSLKWWLSFPSSSLSYGNRSYDYSPFHTLLCMEAECLCNSYDLVQPNIFILTAANWRTTVFLILLLVISHYSTTMAHKKGLQPSTTFWEGTHLTQVFQVFVWEMVSWVCLPTRRFNC